MSDGDRVQENCYDLIIRQSITNHQDETNERMSLIVSSPEYVAQEYFL